MFGYRPKSILVWSGNHTNPQYKYTSAIILMRVDLIICCLLFVRRVSANIETRHCTVAAATLQNTVPVRVRPAATTTQFVSFRKTCFCQLACPPQPIGVSICLLAN